MQAGQIIYLNGTSSSGKTTLAVALQDLMSEPYLRVSVDDFFEMLPPRFDENPTRELTLQVVSGMHRCVAALSRGGSNVVVDDVVDTPAFMESIVQQLSDLPVLFVGVRCSMEECERRERARGDRPIGMAARQYERTHKDGIYDIEVDTSQHTPAECAQQIIERLAINPASNALHRLKEKHTVGAI